jgi:Fe2+ transport system protein FeoA
VVRTVQPDPSNPSRAIEPIPLTQLKRGSSGVLVRTGDDEAGRTLTAMGLRPESRVRVCRGGRHCVVSIETPCGGGCRIGIDRALADRVLVRPA